MPTTAARAIASPWAGFDGHERVVVAEQAGVRMVIALHSTVLGPALGGTRMSLYEGTDDAGSAAYADALRLSRAMTYKNALAGLDHGGGKGVIIADPDAKSADVLRAYGRLVDSLDGSYVTAGDVGMTVRDMDVIGETCPWTTGRSPENGGVGDSGILTAFGVFEGLRASASTVWGTGGSRWQARRRHRRRQGGRPRDRPPRRRRGRGDRRRPVPRRPDRSARGASRRPVRRVR
jgi:glutamate dehydrogenase/leucine dehydrogenase